MTYNPTFEARKAAALRFIDDPEKRRAALLASVLATLHKAAHVTAEHATSVGHPFSQDDIFAAQVKILLDSGLDPNLLADAIEVGNEAIKAIGAAG